MTLKIVLDFLESDATHLNDRKVQEEITEFPWDARDRAITEIMLAVEGLRNRIRLIEAGCCTLTFVVVVFVVPALRIGRRFISTNVSHLAPSGLACLYALLQEGS